MTTEKLTVFTIDRKLWLRGADGVSMLLRPNDCKRCCLGFYGQACDLSDDAQKEIAEPAKLDNAAITRLYAAGAEWLFRGDEDGNKPSEDCDNLIEINDEYIDNALREKEITRIFAENGVKVIFIN